MPGLALELLLQNVCGEHTSGQQGHAFPRPSLLHQEPVPAGARNPSPWRLAVLTHPLWLQESKFFFYPAPSQKVLSILNEIFQRVRATSGPVGLVALPSSPRAPSASASRVSRMGPTSSSNKQGPTPLPPTKHPCFQGRSNLPPPGMGLPFPAPSQPQHCPPRTAPFVNPDLEPSGIIRTPRSRGCRKVIRAETPRAVTSTYRSQQ